MEEEEAIILYPSPPIGHLVSMVELGKLILFQNPSISIHVIVAPPPYQPESTAPYISSADPSITFHRLPAVPPYSADATAATTRNIHESLVLETLCFSNPTVHRTLFLISKKFKIRAMIIDFFCTAVLDVTGDFTFPVYCFFTSGAACLASMLYLPTLHENTTENLKDIGTFLEIPGVPRIRGSDMAKALLERNDEVYECLVMFSQQFPNSSGIIINTFEKLEPRAIKAITEGLCIQNGATPPIYPVGPIISNSERRHRDSGHDCLRWLDSQPEGTVVFLCFGSLGAFSKEQLREIGVGLERSGQRFLWVVRNPLGSGDQTGAESDQTEPDLELLLPDRFLDRTSDRGLVVKSWAPQVAVLNHKAVGGFVTHCGWNSILEAVCAGVPMVAWPLYAEQRFNRVVVVDEIKIALPMNESETGFVSSSEVENRVLELMEASTGGSVREVAKAMKTEAEAALTEAGSSHAALIKLLESWKLK